jgi:putative cell wall-binding protein
VSGYKRAVASPRSPFRALAATAALALVGTVVATAAESTPHTSTPTVHETTVAVPDGALDGGRPRTIPVKGGPELIALTWTTHQSATFQVRAHDRDGWSDWYTLDSDGGVEAGDPGPQSRATGYAGPSFLGHDISEIQLEARGVDPRGLVVHAIDSDPVTTTGVASAATAPAASPPIVTRAQWGADESWRDDSGGDCDGTPDYMDNVKIGVVHHTDSRNDYTPQDSAAIIRGIYDFHVHTQKWCDVAYNFFVDRFGTIFEGRYGGIRRGVIGAATSGVNSVSTSVAVIGTFTDQAPSTDAYNSLVQILAWKLALHGVNPNGSSSVTIGDNSSSKWAAGTTVTLPNIEGHQDSNKTDCPGQFLEAKLPQLRNDVATAIANKGYTPGIDLDRISGPDRYSTAATIATDTFSSAGTAFLARGDGFADALAANYLAGHQGAPILLSNPTSVPAVTINALKALHVGTVHLLGGTTALGPDVAAQLSAAGFGVDRIAGADRYETAAAVAKNAGGGAVGLDPSLRPTAVVSSGVAFPDAMAAGGIVFGKHFPQLLTAPDSLPSATASALSALGITHVYLTGGSGAVSPNVATALANMGIAVDRIAGADRYETSVDLANLAINSLGYSAGHVSVATGENFPDALTGGTRAGHLTAPMVLTAGKSVPGIVCTFLGNRGPATTSGDVFGGSGAIDGVVKWHLQECLEGIG